MIEEIPSANAPPLSKPYNIYYCNIILSNLSIACSPPCNGNFYEVHQCGIAYDRYCEGRKIE